MSGIKALKKLQLGREATKGTPVAATTIWRGMGSLKDNRNVVFPPEDVGILIPTDRSYSPKLEAMLSMDSVPATFEQILHILEGGVLEATPVQDGTGSDYIYTYPIPTTSVPTIKTYTIEGGDNQQAEEMEYSFVQSFTLEGNVGEAMNMSAEWRGRQVANSTFTPALTVPDVEEILTSKFLLYIDDPSSGFGSTLFSNFLLSFGIEWTTGLIPKFTADGELYFSFEQQTAPKVTLNMTFEHDSNAVAEKTAYRNGTSRAVRLIAEGSAVQTAGTTYSNKTVIIDLAGKWSEFGALGDQDGNDIYEATLEVGYNSTLASAGEIIVVNELTAVP